MRYESGASKRVLLVPALLLLLGSGASAVETPAALAEAGPPYRVGENVTRPEKLSGANPVYTEMARKARVQGIVILEAIIDEQGDVTNLQVLKGLPMGLDQAAVEAVRTWKFKPATMDGRPVKVYYTLTVNFQVQDGPPPLGNAFHEFLEKNPEFAAHLQFHRYQEAMELLDRWATERPADSALDLARCFLLLVQGRLDEAWRLALAHRGPERYEVLASVGAVAYMWAANDQTLSAERRAEVVELGLQAESEAMATKPEGALEAVGYKSLLLREKAKLTPDAEERRALEEQASELQKLALELRAKAPAAETAPEPPTPDTQPPGAPPPPAAR